MNPSIEGSTFPAPKRLRPVALTLAFAASLAVAAAVWGYLFLNGHLRLPAWQVVVVPAAFIGWSAAAAARRWSGLLIVLLALGATTMAGLGEWFHVAGGVRANLRSAADHSQAVAIQAAIRSQIANHQQNAKPAQPEPTASSPTKQQDSSKGPPGANGSADLPETTSASPAPASASSDETPASPAASRPAGDTSLTLQLAGKLYLNRLSTYWQGLALSLLLAWFATFQAARMTLQR